MYTIPFQTIDWDKMTTTEHKGTTGIAYWQTILLDGLRIRKVIYSDNYKAILLIIDGGFLKPKEK